MTTLRSTAPARRSLIAAFSLVAAGAILLSGCSSEEPAPVRTTITSLVGVDGPVDYEGGFIQLGAGEKQVDLYFDPMCPYCAEFDKTNATQLEALVDDDGITLRLHSLTFLDALSEGSGYSTRASAALTIQALTDENGVFDYLGALYENQPAERTAGLSNEELAALSTTASTEIAERLAVDTDIQTWSQENTKVAMNGPIIGSDVERINSTPTALVNGKLYEGSPTDAEAFAKFIDRH